MKSKTLIQPRSSPTCPKIGVVESCWDSKKTLTYFQTFEGSLLLCVNYPLKIVESSQTSVVVVDRMMISLNRWTTIEHD
ncbi:hypothetical protein P5673_027863 [Acropora cervicornis]|uniref:Uncharacterized protein n=1 Tax=Acropora cervicornis TaxID=6130 RepID=A0AAD9PY81_ACRCE|nr:hypothetical protein P5673_027863 [Acropora cervicornis]